MRNILLLIFLNFQIAFAQEEQLVAENVIQFKVDEIGNAYYVDQGNAIVKYEPTINRLTRFADLKSGRVKSIDVSNPLRIVVYYADQFTVRFLDVNMTEINNFEIKKAYTNGWVSLACGSNNNGLWLYDELNRRLLKVGQQLLPVMETGDLYLITSKKLKPNFMIEYADRLYLNDPKIGIFVFDLFGGYKKLIPIQGLSEFTFINNRLVYQDGINLVQYSDFRSDSLQLENQGAKVLSANKFQYQLRGTSLFLKKL